MRIFFMVPFLLLVFLDSSFAGDPMPQDSTEEKVSYWTYSNIGNLYVSQFAYGNYWKGSGYNNIAVSTDFDWKAIYKKERRNFTYNLNVQYGLMKKRDQDWVKNRDKLEMSGNYGHQFSNKMFLSALGNIRTFLTKSYKVDGEGNRTELSGKTLSPLTLDIGSGLNIKTMEPKEGEEKKNEHTLDVYYTPFNSKITIVPDSTLAAQYLPEKYRRKGYRVELGSLVRLQMNFKLMENVILSGRADFFTNHLANFGNFDVNIESQLRMQVNKNITVAILGNLIYDEDIKFDILDKDGNPTDRQAPRTQFSESLNVGLTHSF